jgi:hypothetical protein
MRSKSCSHSPKWREAGFGHEESFATGGFQAINIFATMLERPVLETILSTKGWIRTYRPGADRSVTGQAPARQETTLATHRGATKATTAKELFGFR